MNFFGIGPIELLVILVVALLVLGPQQLPKMAYKLGAMVEQARRSVAEARDAVTVDLDLEPRRSRQSGSSSPQSPDERGKVEH